MCDVEVEHTYNLVPWLFCINEKKCVRSLKVIHVGNKTFIQIPWNKQGFCSEDDQLLHKLYAERKGSKVSPKTKPSHNKGKFRNALKKCSALKERTDMHQLSKQMDNFKVYEVLSKEETLEKKEKRRKENPPKKHKSSLDTNPDPQAVYPLTPESTASCSQIFEDSRSSCGEVSAMDLDYSDMDQSLGDATALPHHQIKSTEILSEACQQSQINANLFSSSGSPSTSNNVPPQDLPNEDTRTDQQSSSVDCQEDVSTFTPSTAAEVKWDKARSNLWNYLNNCQLPDLYENLSLYTIRVFYGERIANQFMLDLTTEKRFLYGNHEQQVQNLNELQIIPPEHFTKEPVELPQYEGTNEKITKTLSKMGQGLLFRSDRDGNLYCTRKCGAGIFYYTQADRNEPQKMERGTETKLFSYETFIGQILSNRYANSPRPLKTTRLFIGYKPHTVESTGIVSITIIPEYTNEIMTSVIGSDSSSFFCSETSLDKLVEEMWHLKCQLSG